MGGSFVPSSCYGFLDSFVSYRLTIEFALDHDPQISHYSHHIHTLVATLLRHTRVPSGLA